MVSNRHEGRVFRYKLDDVRSVEVLEKFLDERGSYWMRPGAMKFWRSRVMNVFLPVPLGVLFVSSDRDYRGDRRYSIRLLDEDGVRGLGPAEPTEFSKYATRDAAIRAARKLAKSMNEVRP